MRKVIASLFVIFLLVDPCQASDQFTVSRANDGDIIQFSNGEKVRLTGVDTPDSALQGNEATEFTRQLVEGRLVRLEHDVQQKDKDGRTLAYVWYDTVKKEPLPGAPKLFMTDRYGDTKWSEAIIKDGDAQVITVPLNVRYQELFVSLEKESWEQKSGPWRDAVEVDPKKLSYNLGIEDATGEGYVRVTNAKIGIDYKISKNSTVGVEASRDIYDRRDASAWGKSVKDEDAAQAKYKLLF